MAIARPQAKEIHLAAEKSSAGASLSRLVFSLVKTQTKMFTAMGPISLALTVTCLGIWHGRWTVWEVVCSVPLGVPTGYLAGGMVARVFLLADLLRQNFTRRKDEVAANF